MSIAYFLCGVPGSGKTTFRETHFQNHYRHISSDYVIERIACQFNLKYDDCFKDCIRFAQHQIERELKHLVDQYKKSPFPEAYPDIVWDQTNLTRKSREKKLAMLKDMDYRKVIYVFPTPEPAELENRLLRRAGKVGKTITKEVMDEMIRTFEYPVLEEGWDEIRPYHGGI